MINTRGSVSPRSSLLLPLCLLLACYADVSGSGPLGDDLSRIDPGDTGVLGPDAGVWGVPGGDGGDITPSEAGVRDARVPNDAAASCDGTALGTAQTRTRFEQLQVTAQSSCKQETQSRTCTASGWSAWSGTFAAESCTKAPYRSCGAVAHGASDKRQRYAKELVDNFALCGAEQQTRVCNDGSFGDWSGSAKFERCSVNFLGSCNPISLDGVDCVAGTVCPLLRVPPICVGTAGHVCVLNTECQSGVCAAGVCVNNKVPIGGSCDEAADCTTCAVSGTAVAAVCTAAKLCACGAGASCTANPQCAGTCAGMKCVDANTTCDNDEDCNLNTSKCVKMNGGGSSCLLKDGQPCTKNAQCDHVCRPNDESEIFTQSECAPRGGNDAHCDENFDCAANLVCRPQAGQSQPANVGTHCQAPAADDQLCDETADCAQGPSSTCVGNVCKAPLLGPGSPCSMPQQCQSNVCVLPMPMGGMGMMDMMGACQ